MAASDVPKATRREWIGLGVLVMPILLVSMDTSVLYLALPALTTDLAPSSAQQLWILDIYGFMLAGLLVTMGAVGDRIGTRRLLIIGSAIFGLASLAAAFAHTPELLIAARVLLGLGGATLAPSTLALLRTMFADPVQRGVAIGIWTSAFAGGGAIGPVIGGVLLEYFWWGSVFLINLPIMLALLVLAPIMLPERKNPDPGRFDPLSVVLSIAAMLAVVYAVKHTAQVGFDVQAVVIFVVGVAAGWMFVRRQRRSPNPIIDFALFRVPEFTIGVLVLLVSVFVITGFGLLLTQYLQLVRGQGPLEAGLWSLIPAVAAAVSSVLAPRLIQRFGPRRVLVGAVLAMALGTAVAAFVGLPGNAGSTVTLSILLSGMVIATIGVGTGTTTGSDSVLATAAPEKAGAAGAVSETGAEVGGALGIAVLGSISAATYRIVMGGDLASGDESTLAGSLDAARRLPGTTGTTLAEHARAAYMDGMVLAAVATVVVMLAAAATALVLFGRRPSRDQDHAASRR